MPFQAAPLDPVAREAWLSLQDVPAIDAAIAHDLVRLGIYNPDKLALQDPHKLYQRIAGLDGVAPDPSMIDVYQAAIQAARAGTVTNTP